MTLALRSPGRKRGAADLSQWPHSARVGLTGKARVSGLARARRSAKILEGALLAHGRSMSPHWLASWLPGQCVCFVRLAPIKSANVFHFVRVCRAFLVERSRSR